MKKLKDFIKDIANKGGLLNQDLETVLAASALSDIELPDEFTSKFEQVFLTRDSAKNDPAIVTEIQKASNRNAFSVFDEKANGFLSMLDPEDQDKVKSTKETYEKYDLIRAGLKKALAKGGKGGGEDVKKIEDQWAEKLRQAEEKHQNELNLFKTEQTKQLVDSLVKQKALAYTFGESFSTLKESIADLTVNKVRQKYKLGLDKGSIAVLQDVDGMEREVYENNEKVTIEKLLEKELKPFLAASAGAGDKKDKSGTPPAPIDRSKATLAELRQLQASGVIN